MEGMGVLFSGLAKASDRIGVLFFIIRDARAVQRFERVFTFLFPSLFFLFGFLCAFFLCILLALMLAWTLRSGQPSKCPPSRMFAPMFLTVQNMGSQDRFSIRSDQSINQAKGKTIQKQPLLYFPTR
jgi:hypothetical protein